MKKMLLLLFTIFSMSAFVQPLQPTKESMASLEGLPIELKREIQKYITKSGQALNTDALAKTLVRLSGTSRALRKQINNLDNMLIILNALPKPAKTYLVEKIGKLPVIQENMLTILQTLPRSGAKYLGEILSETPSMQRKEVQKWLDSFTLEKGEELYNAITSENPDIKSIVTLLKNQNIDVNWKNKWDDRPLISAVENGNQETTKLLLEAGALTNIKNDVLSPLDTATRMGRIVDDEQFGNIDIVRMLLAAGANVNAKTKAGNIPLILAAKQDDPALVKLLIDAGANVNAHGIKDTTALMQASEHGYIKNVKLLNNAGAHLDAKDKLGNTALMYASSGLVTYVPEKSGIWPVISDGHIETVRYLLHAGANVNAKNNKGLNAFAIADSHDHTEIAKLLLDAGSEEIRGAKYTPPIAVAH